MHLDNSSKQNLERNLRRSRKQVKNTPQLDDYEASADDIRPIADPELEYEADRSGMIHGRKSTAETTYLEGYGTTNFGVSAYEPIQIWNRTRISAVAGLASVGLLWTLRKSLSSSLVVITNYAFLLRESYRS